MMVTSLSSKIRFAMRRVKMMDSSRTRGVSPRNVTHLWGDGVSNMGIEMIAKEDNFRKRRLWVADVPSGPLETAFDVTPCEGVKQRNLKADGYCSVRISCGKRPVSSS